MARKRETKRQQKIQRALRARYGSDLWIMKVHGGPFQKDGIGDLIGIVCGLGFMFEVKEPDGEERELQRETLKDFRKAGGMATFIEDADEAIKIIDRALARAGKSSQPSPKPKGDRTVLRAEDRKDIHYVKGFGGIEWPIFRRSGRMSPK